MHIKIVFILFSLIFISTNVLAQEFSPFSKIKPSIDTIGTTKWHIIDEYTLSTDEFVVVKDLSSTNDNVLFFEAIFSKPEKRNGTNETGYIISQHGNINANDNSNNLPLTRSLSNVGAPILPFAPIEFLIPQEKSVKSVTLMLSEPESLTDEILLAPIKKPSIVGTSVQIEFNKEVYEKDAWYPTLPIANTFISLRSGYQILNVTLLPTQYKLKKLRFYSKMSVYVLLKEKATGASNELNETHITVPDKNFIENTSNAVSSDLIMKSYDSKSEESSNKKIDYVIITSEKLKSSFRPLLEWRKRTGRSSELITVEEIYNCKTDSGEKCYPGIETYNGDYDNANYRNADQIRSFLRYYKNNHSLQYVLLGGDKNEVPAVKVVYTGKSCREYFPTDDCDANDRYVEYSDMYYACLDGPWNGNNTGHWGEANDGIDGKHPDSDEDVYLGRAPVRDATEASNFVEKTIRYESDEHPSINKWLGVEEVIANYIPLGFLTRQMSKALLDKHLVDNKKWQLTEHFQTFIGGIPVSDDGSPVAELINSNGYHILNSFQHGLKYLGYGLTTASTPLLTNNFPIFANSNACSVSSMTPKNDGSPYSSSLSIAQQLLNQKYGAFATIGNISLGWSGTWPPFCGDEDLECYEASDQLVVRFFDGYIKQKNERTLGYLHYYSKRGSAISREFFDTMSLENEWLAYGRWIFLTNTLYGDPAVVLRKETSSMILTPTSTPTVVTTSTQTKTPTATPTNTFTYTPTKTATNTPSSTPTHTIAVQPTQTPSYTPTAQPTSTRTYTATYTITPQPTMTPTYTTTKQPTSSPTSTFTITPTPTITATALNVIPLVNCIIPHNNTQKSYTAVFGYKNVNSYSVDIKIGDDNQINPSPIDRGQPETFFYGLIMPAFEIKSTDNNSITWQLMGEIVTASYEKSSICENACLDIVTRQTVKRMDQTALSLSQTTIKLAKKLRNFYKKNLDKKELKLREKEINNITAKANSFLREADLLIMQFPTDLHSCPGEYNCEITDNGPKLEAIKSLYSKQWATIRRIEARYNFKRYGKTKRGTSTVLKTKKEMELGLAELQKIPRFSSSCETVAKSNTSGNDSSVPISSENITNKDQEPSLAETVATPTVTPTKR